MIIRNLREFGINYTFLTCTMHSFVVFVRHHRILRMLRLLRGDAFSVIPNNHFPNIEGWSFLFRTHVGTWWEDRGKVEGRYTQGIRWVVEILNRICILIEREFCLDNIYLPKFLLFGRNILHLQHE